MQKWNKILVLSLFLLVVGGAFAFAEEPPLEDPYEQILPRAMIWEILQDHPEVLAKIQEMREELHSSTIPTEEPESTGTMRGRMMRHGQMLHQRMAGRQRMGTRAPLGGYSPMMGPRWNR
jgi:hypothetical protein